MLNKDRVPNECDNAIMQFAIGLIGQVHIYQTMKKVHGYSASGKKKIREKMLEWNHTVFGCLQLLLLFFPFVSMR